MARDVKRGRENQIKEERKQTVDENAFVQSLFSFSPNLDLIIFSIAFKQGNYPLAPLKGVVVALGRTGPSSPGHSWCQRVGRQF